MRSTWCEIDLDQLEKNLLAYRELVGTDLLFVVKANAYGHGLVEVSRKAAASGVSMLGVAFCDEAQQIRDAGIETPLLMMVPIDSSEIQRAIELRLDFMAWRPDHFSDALKAAEHTNETPRLHINIDTGMARAGLTATELQGFLDSLSPEELELAVGICTHFHTADEEDSPKLVGDQLKVFNQARSVAKDKGLNLTAHSANTPAQSRFPETRLDMCRLGVGGYGLDPSPDHAKVPEGVKPVMRVLSRVVDTRTVEAGTGVSYGWEFKTDRRTRLATITIGYADGYRRKPPASNFVVWNRHVMRVVGRVCMDQCVVEIPDDAELQVGDVVEVLGGANDMVSAETISQRWGTNSYDVVASIRSRVPRIFLES